MRVMDQLLDASLRVRVYEKKTLHTQDVVRSDVFFFPAPLHPDR